MLLNEIKDIGRLDLTKLKWDDMTEIMEYADGDHPSNDGPVSVKFSHVAKNLKIGSHHIDGNSFLYKLSYKDIDGEKREDTYAFWVDEKGKITCRAV